MKILLVKPPLNPNLLTLSLYEPLELEYLAASVKGHDVRILDMRIGKNLHRELLDFRPQMAGITGYTCDYNTVIKILKEIRSFDRSINTVVGGHHATFMPDDFAGHFTDAVFLWYADSAFPRYVNALENNGELNDIPNIGIEEGGRFRYTKREFLVPDLDALPLPDRSLTSKYRQKYHDPARNRLTLLMSSRGCLYRCNFCACWKLMDGRYCARSPESIVAELNTLPEENEIVYFSDDNTFTDPARMWKLCELLKENGIRKKLQMYSRADTIVKNESLFAEMAGSGLRYLTVGFESFTDKDLDFYRKKTSVEINDRAIRILKKLNIHILSHFIIRPEYSAEDFRKLHSYVSDKNLFRPAFPVLTPLPGTGLYEETKNSFVIRDFDFFDFTHSVLPTKLGTRDFYRQLTRIYVKSFSLVRYVKHRLNRVLSLNSERYFTDNTDGITFMKLLSISYHTLAMYFKMRFSYLRWTRSTGDKSTT